MNNIFFNSIEELYRIIISPIDKILKYEAVRHYKSLLEIDDKSSFGDIYSSIITESGKAGTVYTPLSICNYMVENLIEKEDIVKNPFLKILDPSCGCGNIILACFRYLKNIYEENSDKLNISNIDEHIVKNNLFGFDTDKYSIMILNIDLFMCSGYVSSGNFIKYDFLLFNDTEEYDMIIGNPPYIGHKQIGKNYMADLKKIYSPVYKDKGDISFCFLYKSIKSIKGTGKIAVITSRYFLEAQNGKKIRKAILCESNPYKIIDFYGIRPFKGVGIDPLIIFIKGKSCKDISEIEVIKPKIDFIKNKYNGEELFFENKDSINNFTVMSADLGEDSWILKGDEEYRIIKKIISACDVELNEVCSSHQGIITGCDKAFIVDENIITEEHLEKEILKPWIKSSYIDSFSVGLKNKYIIYSDLIDKENNFTNCLKHIENYKEKLNKRRECIKGIRKWYELQWGREQKIFEDKKIVFPYKASKNRFAFDKGSFFSADVYCLTINPEFMDVYSYNILLNLLNSPVYSFYFKSFAKKLGRDLFEYYPNNLMKLRLPLPDNIKNYSNDYLFEYFKLTRAEIKRIMEYY